MERLVHRDLGIATNKDGATIIDGVELRSISGIHRAIWERMKTTEAYRRLDAVDRQMAEELFEIVTYGTTLVRRTSGKVTSSVQGDNLEGNILMNVGLRHLTNIFVQLTNGYLRYGKHLLSEEELANVKRV